MALLGAWLAFTPLAYSEPLVILDEAERLQSDAGAYLYLWAEPRESDGEKISIHQINVDVIGHEREVYTGEKLEKLADPASVASAKGSIYTFSNRPGQRVEAIGLGRGSILVLRLPLPLPLKEVGHVKVATAFWHGAGMTPSLKVSVVPDEDQAVAVATDLQEVEPSGQMGWASFEFDKETIAALQSGQAKAIEGNVRP